MKVELEQVLPMEIEKRSFEIIEQELKERQISIDERLAPVIKRVIHTTADFEYADTLCFSDNVLEQALSAIKNGASIVTDTKMAWSGINKKVLEHFGGQVYNFISDEDVAKMARERKCTRSTACMDKASVLTGPLIFAIGNAPTALVRLYELYEEGIIKPDLIIGVPVGFVNVVQSKELIMSTNIPYIVAKGRKGGSNVAAAICNALLYLLDPDRK